MNKRVIEIVRQWNDYIDKLERHAGVAYGGSLDYGDAGRSAKKCEPIPGKADTLRKIPITDAERTSFRIIQALPQEARSLLSAFVSSDPEKCRKPLRELAREAGYVSIDDYKAARGCAEEACLLKDKYWNPSLYYVAKAREAKEAVGV